MAWGLLLLGTLITLICIATCEQKVCAVSDTANLGAFDSPQRNIAHASEAEEALQHLKHHLDQARSTLRGLEHAVAYAAEVLEGKGSVHGQLRDGERQGESQSLVPSEQKTKTPPVPLTGEWKSL